MRTPKHFHTLGADKIHELSRGFNRFRFGFASPGEKMMVDKSEYTFIGNFTMKKQAIEVAEKHPDYRMPGAKGVTVHPYLFGRQARGWAVYAWDNHN